MSPKDLMEALNATGKFNVPLKVKHVKEILNTLVYDGMVAEVLKCGCGGVFCECASRLDPTQVDRLGVPSLGNLDCGHERLH